MLAGQALLTTCKLDATVNVGLLIHHLIMRSPLLVLAIAALGLSSCSIGYNREWSKAKAQASHQPPKDMSGPWLGTWRSDVNGHNGELRCIVTPLAGNAGQERFHYHATFMKILSATYDVTHVVKPVKGGFTFAGDQVLTGAGGGLYHYEGNATPSTFHATFRSEKDHGVFEMKRP